MLINEILNNKFDNHIFPLYWIKGEDFKTIEITLDKMIEAHIYSFIVESRTHPQYLEDKWFVDIKFIADEAKKRNMKFWLFDDNHFPTGSINDALKEERPDLRKEVLKFIRFEVLGPLNNIKYSTEVFWDKTSKFHSIVAVQEDKTINLTNYVKDKEVYFDLPSGKWDIYLIYTSRETDFHKYHINMVDKDSCDFLIERIYEEHYKQLKEYFGNTLLGFFSDEPGFQNEKGNKSDSKIGKEMPLPWSIYVEEKMISKFGENYVEVLPSLWKKRNNSSNVRVEYMNIVTDLYLEFFDNRIGTWCRDRGIMHLGHIIEDRDSHARLGPGVGHFFKSMLGQDMSGIDIVLNQIQPGLDDGKHTYFRGEWDNAFFHYTLVKLGTSLARIHPLKQGRTMAEVFGAFGWHEGTKLMKWIVDHFLVRGVNYFVPHAFSMDTFPDPDCPPHFYAHGNDPFFEYFKELMLYTQKVSSLFSNGKYSPKVALLYHAESEWSGEYMDITLPSKYLTQNMVGYDIIPQDVFKANNPYNTDLSNSLNVNDNEYDVLVIPYSEYISKELMEFINQDKVKVIFINDTPSGLYNDSSNLILNNYEVMNEKEFDDYLFNNNELRGFEINERYDYLRYYKYSKNDETYHMFFNEHPYNNVVVDNLILKANYELNILTNYINKWENRLILAPYESKILVETSKNIETNQKDYKFLKNLDFKFNVSYSYPTNYPNFETCNIVNQPIDLTKELYKGKSGIFKYTKEMKFPSDSVLIELGNVSEAVSIILDGKVMGRRLVPPYNFKLENLDINKTYELEFEVSNTLNHQYEDILSFCEPMQPTGLLSEIIIRY
ncbi:MAG: glycoside hydrolase family 2 [Erysipelotrichaceae bacterium]|nr:glycoside hydrolase family 2 [Erysipelotrichaceae bacterium]